MATTVVGKPAIIQRYKNIIKVTTKILAESLVDHFVFTFDDPPCYIVPKLYGGRHEESGYLVVLLVTREHGD
jgi:hypothetical protein